MRGRWWVGGVEAAGMVMIAVGDGVRCGGVDGGCGVAAAVGWLGWCEGGVEVAAMVMLVAYGGEEGDDGMVVRGDGVGGVVLSGSGGRGMGTKGRGVAARGMVDPVDRLIRNVFSFGRKARRKSFPAAANGGGGRRRLVVGAAAGGRIMSERERVVYVLQEVPKIQSSSLLTVPVSVILEPTVLSSIPKITTEALATTISPFIPQFILIPQHSTPIPTPTTTKAATSTLAVQESKTLTAIHLRLSDLEKEVKELRNVDHSASLLATIKFDVLATIKEYLGTSLGDALYKVLQRHTAEFI
ncbi:hypothetical protein Tco_0536278 [Tanacetum coccineum]